MKFIIKHWNNDLYKMIFSSVNDGKRAVFIDRDLNERNLRRIIATQRKIPFKNIIQGIAGRAMVRTLTQGIDLSGVEPCFILPPGWLTSGIRKYVLSMYPNAKIVCMFSDSVDASPEKQAFMKKARNQADLILTYDEGDAEKYNLTFMPLPYPYLEASLFDTTPVSDLCFIGINKDRLELLCSIAEYLGEKGIVCDFHLVCVPKEERIYVKGITYHDDFIPYQECLRISAESRCILELVQEGSLGMTMRVPEAIFLNRKLLSNNKGLISKASFMPKNMSVFSSVDEIDTQFIIEKCFEYPEGLKDSFSPELFLKNIEICLKEMHSK